MLLAVDLIVWVGGEVRVGGRVLGLDGVAVVAFGRPDVLSGIADAGLYVEQFAHLLTDGLVIVEQELPARLKKGTQVVLVILEEGRLTVGRLQGVPVQVAPLAVVADADVADTRYEVQGTERSTGTVSAWMPCVVAMRQRLR